MNQALNIQDVQCHSYNFQRQSYGPEEVAVNLPAQCSHCSKIGSQVHITSVYTDNNDLRASFDISDVITIMGCPYCNNHTIHLMHYTSQFVPYEANEVSYYQSFQTIPNINSDRQIFDRVEGISSDFVKIYTQALNAENNNLSEIAGMGFRKALEFLVTDYLLYIFPDKKETLEHPKTTLGNKIDMLPGDLKSYAKASSYLGNDETHYSRRHPELGIQDLKAFIDLVVIEIERDVIREKARKLLNKP